MNTSRYHWRSAVLNLQKLEDRTSPAALNALVSRSEPTLYGQTPSGNSYVDYDPSFLRLDSEISADGRYVAFQSLATNVIAGQVDTNEAYDIFLFDRVTSSTALVSGENGSPTITANGFKKHPVGSEYVNGGGPTISADGRYVSFTSNATNLVPGFVSANGSPNNVYLYDRISAKCSLVSHQFNGSNNSGSASSESSTISENNQVIIFQSFAVDLVAGFPNPGGGTTSAFQHAYAYDLPTGQIALLDHKFGSGNEPASGNGFAHRATPDGRYILIRSSGSDMLSMTSTSKGDVYRHDRQTGINQLISRSSNVVPFGGNAPSGGLFLIRADGNWVVFSSSATNLVPGATTSGTQIVMCEVDTGVIRLVSHDAANSLIGGDNTSRFPDMSDDGRYVAFRSLANNLVTGFVNGNAAANYDVFLYDRDTDQVSLVNHKAGALATSGDGGTDSFFSPQISADGRFVQFADLSSDLVLGFVDGNHRVHHDLFRYDRTNGQITLISGKNNSATLSGNGESQYSAMSADGKYVAIASEASDLASTIVDANGRADVFVKELASGNSTLASRRAGLPSLSAGGANNWWVNQTPDGRFVVYTDSANNLVPGQVDDNDTIDVFLLDRTTNVTVLVSHTAASQNAAGNANSGIPVISADGRYVAYCSYATDLVAGFIDSNGPLVGSNYENTDVFLYDRITGANELVSRKAGTTNVGGNYTSGTFFVQLGKYLSISGDGRWVFFQSQSTDLINGFVDNNGTVVGNGGGSDVFVYDRVAGSNALVSHLPGQPLATANSTSFAGAMSADGRYISYWTNSSDIVTGMIGGGGRNVILYDRVADVNVLVSHAAGSPTGSGNGGSNDPAISRDGKFVVYQSAANNLIAGGNDVNNDNDIFLYDRQSGTNILVSHTATSVANAGSLTSFLLSAQDNSEGRYISADGRYIVYESQAQDLVDGFVDTNDDTSFPSSDVYLFDRISGVNVLVSRSLLSPVVSGNKESSSPTISGDGRFVAFGSSASDLVAGFIIPESGNTGNLYVYDRRLASLALVTHDVSNSILGADIAAPSLTINGDGSVIAYTSPASTLVAGDLNQFTDVFAYVTPPPRVASIKINEGSVQRSTVRSITVSFDEPVFFSGDPAAAFTLTRNGSVGSVQCAVSIQNNPNGTVTLTFSGALTQFGSLIDGNYSLSINAAMVSNIAALDGNGDGMAGDNWVSPIGSIFRLFGDADGNRTVNTADFDLIRFAFGTDDQAFDFDNDGSVAITDFNKFRANFGQSI